MAGVIHVPSWRGRGFAGDSLVLGWQWDVGDPTWNATGTTGTYQQFNDLMATGSNYNFTVNDPDVLLEPWTSYTYVRRLNPNPNRQDEATECDERDLELLADPFLRG